MADVYLGQIILFAGPFTIRNFAMCNGQLLQIAQNTALFSILGTTYGGDGVRTFALPNLQGCVPLHIGQTPGGGTNYVLGQSGGQESVTLTQAQMPSHNHFINVQTGLGSLASPQNNYLATTKNSGSNPPGFNTYAASNTSGAQLNQQAVSPVGQSQPHENRQPFLALNYQIALQGIFPSRS